MKAVQRLLSFRGCVKLQASVRCVVLARFSSAKAAQAQLVDEPSESASEPTFKTLKSVEMPPMLENNNRNEMKQFDNMLRKEHVSFKSKAGETIEVEAVIQDTCPIGCELGTVVTLHGAPGSHRDFRYIIPLLHAKGIRVVGVNFPAYGITPGDHRLQFDNVERDNFVEACVNKIGANHNVVVMGHSRGAENATGTAARLAFQDSCLRGLVLLAPTGLSLHRGLRPLWVLHFAVWLDTLGSIISSAVRGFMYFFYNHLLGLKLDSGERAVICMRTMQNLEMRDIQPKIDKINDSQAQILVAYSGSDILIEKHISHEFASAFHDHHHVQCMDKSDDSVQKTITTTKDLLSKGTKTVSVLFEKEGHFIQKHQAVFIAASIEAILRNH